MKKYKNEAETYRYRNELVQFLNEYGLNGMAILAMIRESEVYTYAPGEVILEQGKRSKHIFFLVTGSVTIHVMDMGHDRAMGETQAMTMLGEIAYFNNTPASATAIVGGTKPALVFRLSYTEFAKIIVRFPDVKGTLARIGDLRIIKQLHGFVGYSMFMDMIGWKKDRFAMNRAFAEDLENAVHSVFVPALKKKNSSLLEVGDGPGLVSEILYESYPEMLDSLHLQVNFLEESIANPGVARPSDFTRANRIKQKFDAIVALQVFNVASRGSAAEQFKIAHDLLRKGGVLLAVKTQILPIMHDTGASGNLIFNSLEELVEKHWPGAAGSKHLIETTFVDADLDPLMEWNKKFCEKARLGKLKFSKKIDKEERVLLSLLLEQAKESMFDPEELHFRWLGWKAGEAGFKTLKSEKNTDNAFFFFLFRRA